MIDPSFLVLHHGRGQIPENITIVSKIFPTNWSVFLFTRCIVIASPDLLGHGNLRDCFVH